MAESKIKGKSIRKTRKVKKSRNKILYLIASLVVAIFIFSAGILVIIVSSELQESSEGKPPARIEESHLVVEEVFFIKSNTRTDDGYIDIYTTVYLTNDGLDNAENVEIHAYPRNDQYNFGSDKVKTGVGKIPKQKTAEIEFLINVPTGEKVDVDLIILEDDRLIMTGSGSVVISGKATNVEKFKTNMVSGTQNDSDYDGMPDVWETYYGLNPSDPTDAQEDADGDGLCNLEEYKNNNYPCDPTRSGNDDIGFFGKAEEKSSVVVGFAGLIVIFIIIIIVVAIIGAVVTRKTPPQDNKRAQEKNPTQSKINPQTSSASHHQQIQYAQPTWRCPRCGGWLSNGICLSCGGRFGITPLQQQQQQPQQQSATQSNNNEP